MRIETRIALTRHLQALARGEGCPMAEQRIYSPVAEYADPAHLARERSLLFRRYPVVVAHISRLPTPGSFLTEDVAGLPILVVRQDDDSIRAFVNLCRHRGAIVVEERSGRSRRFACPYHGWSYDTEGCLRAIREPAAFSDVARERSGLIPLPTEVRHGLVWIVADPTARLDVAAHLGELDDELSSFALDSYVEERATELRADLNWKLVVDGFLETYHLPILHRETIGPYIRAKPAPFTPFGRHGRMVALRQSFDQIASAEPESADLLPHVAIIYQVFPNTVLVWQGDHFEIWAPFPADEPGRSVSRVSLLARSQEEALSRRGHWDRNWKILMDTVQQEDFRVGRGMQRGFATGAQEHVVFGRNEPALQHFHESLRGALSEADIGTP